MSACYDTLLTHPEMDRSAHCAALLARFPCRHVHGSVIVGFVCQSACENLRLASVAGLYLSRPVAHGWSRYLMLREPSSYDH